MLQKWTESEQKWSFLPVLKLRAIDMGADRDILKTNKANKRSYIAEVLMNRSTYQTLRAQMALKGHSLSTLSRCVEMKYHTLLRKMRRESEFTLNEALRIREVLCYPGAVENLFKSTEEGAAFFMEDQR